jgi:hypothetical protein
VKFRFLACDNNEPILANKKQGVNVIAKLLLAIPLIALLAACESPTTQRYAISADNNVAIKTLDVKGVAVGSFQPPAIFSENCRALGALRVSDGMNHTQYIQKAFEDELKVAGALSQGASRVTLSGKVSRLEFNSMRAVTGGSWTIGLELISSNGKSMNVTEYYEFDSGFSAPEACRQTAEAFSRAVQNLISKTVKDQSFALLVR